MEFAFKYEIWELHRLEKFPETHVLATLLTGNALLLNGKKISQQVISISRFLEVCVAQV